MDQRIVLLFATLLYILSAELADKTLKQAAVDHASITAGVLRVACPNTLQTRNEFQMQRITFSTSC